MFQIPPLHIADEPDTGLKHSSNRRLANPNGATFNARPSESLALHDLEDEAFADEEELIALWTQHIWHRRSKDDGNDISHPGKPWRPTQVAETAAHHPAPVDPGIRHGGAESKHSCREVVVARAGLVPVLGCPSVVRPALEQGLVVVDDGLVCEIPAAVVLRIRVRT